MISRDTYYNTIYEGKDKLTDEKNHYHIARSTPFLQSRNKFNLT